MLLLIPGPVTTRPEVRAAMAQDYAPWDNDFRPLYAGVRARLLAIAGADAATHTTIALQGCGHFGIEAALRSFLPPGGRILVPITGGYAERMVRLAREAGRVPVPLPISDTAPIAPGAVAAALAADPTLSHVGIVYSETSSGIAHDAAAIGAAARGSGRRMLLDAVSAFGALPLDVAAMPELDVVVFTANKCLEGMPGLSFSIARIDRLEACAGHAGSWSFNLADIHAQYKRSGPGSFRFTPPAQVLGSLQVALDLFEAEGGQPARLARYRANARVLHEGMRRIGLTPCLDAATQGPVVLNVHAPDDPAWNLQRFVDLLKARGYLISNFYNTRAPSFRVGCIGAVTPDDMAGFVVAADAALAALGVANRGPRQDRGGTVP
jgi:2-aminoethylphosphonate-pyruvate transaminase